MISQNGEWVTVLPDQNINILTRLNISKHTLVNMSIRTSLSLVNSLQY